MVREKATLISFRWRYSLWNKCDVVRDTLVTRPHYKHPSGGTASQEVEFAP